MKCLNKMLVVNKSFYELLTINKPYQDILKYSLQCIGHSYLVQLRYGLNGVKVLKFKKVMNDVFIFKF